jgi:hypothetical protein
MSATEFVRVIEPVLVQNMHGIFTDKRLALCTGYNATNFVLNLRKGVFNEQGALPSSYTVPLLGSTYHTLITLSLEDNHYPPPEDALHEQLCRVSTVHGFQNDKM